MRITARQVVSTLVQVILLVASTTLDAQVLVPPMAFDCDAEPGSASTWTTGISSADLRVRGTIEFNQLRRQLKWAPVASVVFIDRSDAQSGFQIFTRRFESKDMLEVAMASPEPPTAQIVILAYPWKGKPLPFTLAISESGEVNVTVGDKSASLKVNRLEQDRLSLLCSAANVVFSDIVITSSSDDT